MPLGNHDRQKHFYKRKRPRRFELDVMWVSAMVVCRVCGYRFGSVYPTNIHDDSKLECANCGNLSCEPEDSDEEAT